MAETLESRYIKAVKRLRTRIGTMNQMATWREELEARLWRAEIVMWATGIAKDDLGELEREIHMFNEVVKALDASNTEREQRDDIDPMKVDTIHRNGE